MEKVRYLKIKKKYKIIICNNKDIIIKMIKYFKYFINLKSKYKYMGLDFEFNRSLDNTKREIALFQIKLEANDEEPYIFMFYPPDLNSQQIDTLIEILIEPEIIKIIHGGEALDIPYLFLELIKDKKLHINFCKNLFDTRYLCEYYNLDNKLIENKCKIYYLLKQMNVINEKEFDFLKKRRINGKHI